MVGRRPLRREPKDRNPVSSLSERSAHRQAGACSRIVYQQSLKKTRHFSRRQL